MIPETPFQTGPYGRVQRFRIDDFAKVVRGGSPFLVGQISEVVCDPHPATFSHCAGKSARYRFTFSPDWFYDWQLERATYRDLMDFAHGRRATHEGSSNIFLDVWDFFSEALKMVFIPS